MNKEKLLELEYSIRNIPDFPVKGIQFKDITTLLKEPDKLLVLADMLVEEYKNYGITKVVGIESRGFIMGAILAAKLKAGFVPIRKPGKLPGDVLEETYSKEYGEDKIQIHRDSLNSEDVVLLHDDLLATGGTAKAACNLILEMGVRRTYVNFIIELENLKGRQLLPKEIEVSSLIKFKN